MKQFESPLHLTSCSYSHPLSKGDTLTYLDKLGRGFYKYISLIVMLLASTVALDLNAQCPVIQIEDLRGVIGFPQFDNTSQCGAPDTLSLLIFTDAPGDILGFDLTVLLEDGIEYGLSLIHI